jgi:hypothetical protein
VSKITRFHVRDGYVLDEHPTGSVVRYDHHVEVVKELEKQLYGEQMARKSAEQNEMRLFKRYMQLAIQRADRLMTTIYEGEGEEGGDSA